MFGSFRVWIAVPRTMPRPATPPPPKHVQETYALRGSSRPRANASSNPETEISCCLWVWMLSRVREQDPRNRWNFAVARLFAVGQKLFSIRWLVDLFFSKRRLVAFYWIVARRDGFVKTLRERWKVFLLLFPIRSDHQSWTSNNVENVISLFWLL